MPEIFDFSNALIHCSSIYHVVSDGKEKTPKQKYDFLCAVLIEEITKYEEMGERKQGMASGIKKAAKIAGLEYEIRRLEPRKHEHPLSKGAKSYLKRVYSELKYGKWSTSKDIGNKYVNKGKQAEVLSLELISLLDGIQYLKNEVRLRNDFLTGVPDTFIGESIENAIYVPDVKSSWDIDTFMDNIGKPLHPLYWWQEQGYFDLTGALSGEVSFCLVNTPDSIIEEEKYKLAKRLDAVTCENEEYRLQEAILVNNLTFDDMPPRERRLRFEVKRNEDAIKKIHETVPKCREYLAEIQELHLTGFFKDADLPMLENIEEI